MLKTTVGHRDLMPDLIRAWAIIGIVLVNVEMFSAGLNIGYPSTGEAGDHWAKLLVNGLFTLKSYSLFSMMFGAGLGYQLASAARTETNATGRYYRRMIGLLALGLIHVVFLFLGDILVTYAILGSLLYFCRNGKPKTLIIWGLVLIGIQTALMMIGAGAMAMMEGITDPAARRMMDDQMAEQREAFLAIDAIFADGSFLQIAAARASLIPTLIPTVIMVQGISAFGFFLIGLGFFKLGLLSQPDHKFWKTSLFVLLPIGLILSFYGSNVYVEAPQRESAQGLFGMAIMILGSPFSTFGYIGVIALIARMGTGPVLQFLARGGSATLSAYLLQSVIMCIVTLPIGFGLFGQLGALPAVLIALATGIFTLCFVSLWLTKFKRGPMEILLRRWTYLGYRQPLQRNNA
ncbi:DUF418 domain-containing protein [Ponticaulis sp.]|uniref:DUF418 domain-containing protein n=1 Tax=Ponticaulis sp. TaxID=2020902 RepID=UPI0026372E06|nr:DUF418 domain-containing protein [Ponticaulis sp.]MDF1679557.1 DUF418 domain-containing protein [Ponticaulis sp.]